MLTNDASVQGSYRLKIQDPTAMFLSVELLVVSATK